MRILPFITLLLVGELAVCDHASIGRTR